MNMGVQIPIQVPAFNSLDIVPRSGIVKCYGNSMLDFWRNCHTDFPSCCSILWATYDIDHAYLSPWRQGAKVWHGCWGKRQGGAQAQSVEVQARSRKFPFVSVPSYKSGELTRQSQPRISVCPRCAAGITVLLLAARGVQLHHPEGRTGGNVTNPRRTVAWEWESACLACFGSFACAYPAVREGQG